MDLMPWLLAYLLWANSLFAAGWNYDPATNAFTPPAAPEKGQIVGQGKTRR